MVTDWQVCRHQQAAHGGMLSPGFIVGPTLQNITRTLQNLSNAERSTWWRQYSVRGASGFSRRGPRLPQQGLQQETCLPEQNKRASQCGGNTKSCHFVYNCNAKLNAYLFTYVTNIYSCTNKCSIRDAVIYKHVAVLLHVSAFFSTHEYHNGLYYIYYYMILYIIILYYIILYYITLYKRE